MFDYLLRVTMDSRLRSSENVPLIPRDLTKIIASGASYPSHNVTGAKGWLRGSRE